MKLVKFHQSFIVPLLRTAVNDRYASQKHIASGQLPDFIRNDQLPPYAPVSWITMSGARCWRPITSSTQYLYQSPNSKKRYRWSETAYHKNRSRLLASHYELSSGKHTQQTNKRARSRNLLHCLTRLY